MLHLGRSVEARQYLAFGEISRMFQKSIPFRQPAIAAVRAARYAASGSVMGRGRMSAEFIDPKDPWGVELAKKAGPGIGPHHASFVLGHGLSDWISGCRPNQADLDPFFRG